MEAGQVHLRDSAGCVTNKKTSKTISKKPRLSRNRGKKTIKL
jgi:hypothetical protein